jgi:hypothetical protein
LNSEFYAAHDCLNHVSAGFSKSLFSVSLSFSTLDANAADSSVKEALYK